ncbi:sugar diacid recognition domain-containing protein [Anaerococcus porci]|uniref:CdaR family transcriptional regulator n=1 Tax=Anaerococcus porci TaxID=2652269 RepID=UPI002A761916|nr:sugar diacid recognition domain-containing protein [Anaerococcus porci]MDY3006684.1 sugar diacid recognition domain-containing protein [Anaerococcus porci]
MKINENLAQNIVESLKDTIKQDINFMDQDGIIIASTDLKRIGSIHNGAIECITLGRTIGIIYDNEYPGAKKGVNLPVKFDKETIGVIGISGEYEIVKKYGTIIKRMTEILIKEEWIKENQNIEFENKKYIIESILNSQLYNLDFLPKNIETDAKAIAVSKIKFNSIDFSTKRNLIKLTESNYKNNKLYTSIIHDRFVIVYLDCTYDDINKHLNLIVNHANNSYNLKLNFGVSSIFYNLDKAHEFYKQALRSQKWSEYNNKKGPILFYKYMDLGLILTSIEDKDLYEFSYKILKNIDNKDIEIYEELFFLYGKYNGSITAIADNMFMHKNSIQYRLNKLESLTGYDPRKYNDYVVLWFAFFTLKNSENY